MRPVRNGREGLERLVALHLVGLRQLGFGDRGAGESGDVGHVLAGVGVTLENRPVDALHQRPAEIPAQRVLEAWQALSKTSSTQNPPACSQPWIARR